MFNLFKRRPPPDPEQVARIKGWVAAHMTLEDDDHVSVAELACHEPGCPDFETVVTVLKQDKRRFVLRFPTPVLEVSCSIPDDHIDPRRTALFMARSILREVRDGGRPC